MTPTSPQRPDDSSSAGDDQPRPLVISPIVVAAEVVPAASCWSSADADTRSRFASSWIAGAIGEVLADRDTAVLGLVGGSSVGPVYVALATHDEVDWSRVVVTIGDERVVPTESDQRNWRVIESLTKPLVATGRLPGDNLAPLPDLDPDDPLGPSRAAVSLSATVDHIDVAILSLGPDGHVASLFPNHDALGQPGVFVPVEHSPKPPPRRVTASVATMAAVDSALLLAVGDAKEEAARAVAQPGPLAAIPGRIVHLCRRGIVVSDRPLS